MAGIRGLLATDDRGETVAALARLSPRTLRILLPASGAGAPLVVEAIRSSGGADLRALVDEVQRITASFVGEWGSVQRNQPDATLGVLDPTPVRTVLGSIGETEGRAVLGQFEASDREYRPAATLLAATMGWNSSEIEKKLAARDQISARAYGLLPLPDGAAGIEACAERYAFLQEYIRGSRKYGQQRRANEKAAALAGMANLAHNAGYHDPNRLEWAMEARKAEEAAAVEAVEEGDYRLSLDEEDPVRPRIAVEKKGRRLKSVPAALRKHEGVVRLKAAVDALKAQAPRFCRSLETLCEVAEPIGREDLEGLARLPAARGLLDRIVFRSGDRFGVWDVEACGIRDLASGGETHVVSPGERVAVAHPLDLLEGDRLAAWQRAVVEHRVVQPFRQVFREIYILTPAERDPGLGTHRFAGHTLVSRVVAGLLSSRGWTSTSGDAPETFKLFTRAGLRANIDWESRCHYLTETETIVSGSVDFERHPNPGGWRLDRRVVPLAEVPPRIFSEVMRDVDLIVSVAQEEEAGFISPEACLRRGEILERLLADLGLPGVTIDGHHARIEGRLASYRVHLMSGVVQIEPGRSLCIIPDRRVQKSRPLYLPFADEEDPGLSEIISKVLLLVHDDKIRDKAILDQIRAAK